MYLLYLEEGNDLRHDGFNLPVQLLRVNLRAVHPIGCTFCSKPNKHHVTWMLQQQSKLPACTCWHQATSCYHVPSTGSAGLAEAPLAFDTSHLLSHAALALQGLNCALSFMRSYSLILARALSKWITVLPVRVAQKGEQGESGKGSEINEGKEKRKGENINTTSFTGSQPHSEFITARPTNERRCINPNA